MKVLAVASEFYPLIKTGGLADVVGALPGALAAHGVAVTTLIPGYPAVMHRIGKGKAVKRYADLFGAPARLLRAHYEGLDLLVLDAPALFERDGGAYLDPSGHDWPDNWRRFAALSAVGADIAGGGLRGFAPDLVHVHDWQAAMALAYMKHSGAPAEPGVITIHDLAFQGRFDASVFGALGLPPSAYALDGVEYYGGVGFLKAGLQYADAITTVSPSYAAEIMTPELGMGLDGLISNRAGVLHGIVNGIDTDEWNPASDPLIPATYGPRRLSARQRNRRAIEKRFGLKRDDAMLFCVISRLAWQKGIDLLADQIDALVAMGAKLAVLGSGDAALEGALLGAASRHRGRVGVMLGYDEPVAHLLQAGSDAILVPSRTEPCGLTQLYGLRYGCVPVVTRTGGLADTVIDANDAALAQGVATGVQFWPLTPETLHRAIARAVALHARPDVWAAIQRRGMAADNGWGRSAGRYAALYAELVRGG